MPLDHNSCHGITPVEDFLRLVLIHGPGWASEPAGGGATHLHSEAVVELQLLTAPSDSGQRYPLWVGVCSPASQPGQTKRAHILHIYKN